MSPTGSPSTFTEGAERSLDCAPHPFRRALKSRALKKDRHEPYESPHLPLSLGRKRGCFYRGRGLRYAGGGNTRHGEDGSGRYLFRAEDHRLQRQSPRSGFFPGKVDPWFPFLHGQS